MPPVPPSQLSAWTFGVAGAGWVTVISGEVLAAVAGDAVSTGPTMIAPAAIAIANLRMASSLSLGVVMA
jgi:hypothetical protein